MAQDPNGNGLPDLDDATLERLRPADVRWVVMLAEREDEMVEGHKSLIAAGLGYSPRSKMVLEAGDYVLHVEVFNRFLTAEGSEEPQ
jgi:hypothetical protein